MSRLWLRRDTNSPVERKALALDASRVKLSAMKQVRRCRKYFYYIVESRSRPMTDTKTSYATCPLCEATCGLQIVTRGREIIAIRWDTQDVFSLGYICPKADSLKELHDDRDCIRKPMVRMGDQWMSVGWDDAFAEIEQRLVPILQQHGRDALAIYVGNPNAHNLASLLYLPVLIRAAGTHNFFSASTVDQMPKHVAAGLMFGTALSIPIPDLERTEYLLLLGANPLV